MTKRVLPPGIDEPTFRRALVAFASAIGKQWVFDDPDADLPSYRDPYAIVDDNYFIPSAAIAPSSVEEVQACLRIANEFRIPLWPISGGRNLAYGGPAPRLPGTLTLDLKRMNRIIEVNEEFGYALVEPGVTFFDLYDYLQKHKIKLWLDVPDPGWGTVMGTTLERGAGYTPYGDHYMMQCGMEVVLADGDVVRTGMGALPGSTTWQLFKHNFGPHIDGLFTQSNFGVVTKIGKWLMPEPPGYRPYLITFDKEDDIEPVVEILRPLKINMVVQNAATIRDLTLVAAINSTRSQYHDGDGPLPESAKIKIMADHDIGMWNFYGALYGPPSIMDAHWEIIKGSFSQVPGARFFFPEDRPKENDVLHHRARTMAGIPTLTEFGFVNWVGGGGHIDFSPISPTTGKDALKQYKMVKNQANRKGFDYMGVFIIGWREMHHVFTLVFDRSSPEVKKNAHELFETLVEEAAAAGYGEYRTHLEFMDQIAATYNWNDNALMRLNERLKDALDPNGILAPGKQGIWPKQMRNKKP
ncbi:MAG: 4-cresol dehydrogenase (hydroxylating) [Gammaproteobacteria bacterium]|jgi:4-cresol dehydrogenase (hydroxylating)